MSPPLDTPRQLSALQTLYSRWAAHAIQEIGDVRAARLSWASEILGRKVESFKALDSNEAGRLIDVLKVSTGQEVRPPRRRIRSREVAKAAGTAGRRGVRSATIYMVSAEDLARINDAIVRLGSTRERFDAWLNSQYSPLRGRADKQIRTIPDANRVWWALKAMLKHAGRWRVDDRAEVQTLRTVRCCRRFTGCGAARPCRMKSVTPVTMLSHSSAFSLANEATLHGASTPCRVLRSAYPQHATRQPHFKPACL